MAGVKSGVNHTHKGHRAGERQKYCLYSVYDNRTGLPVIVYATADKCCKAMGIKLQSFYHTICCGKKKKWTIIKYFIDEV